MTGPILSSPINALPVIAKAFEHYPVCTLSVWEESAFGTAGELSLGEIQLFAGGSLDGDFLSASKNGAFEWRTPTIEVAKGQLEKLLSLDGLNGDAKEKADDKLRRTLDSFGAIPVRLGMSHPIFDPRSLETMPFRRPTTVVADTSGVVQGGLSFVGRYLHPSARIKVPAVVQMEIVNFADRFFSNKRSTKVKPLDLLMDHTKSQGSQRVLLQLELHSDVELERTFLLGDPLRGAFQREEEKELRELNMNVSIRAYADRLILEAVRQHQTQVSFGHPVMLLTCDQGLARMALAEGVAPLYFRSAKASAIFGRRLTGTSFHPFNGSLSTTNVADLLWELATVFGCARLKNLDTNCTVSVYAMGKEFAWAPYHSQDDLLWLESVSAHGSKESARPRKQKSKNVAATARKPRLATHATTALGSSEAAMPTTVEPSQSDQVRRVAAARRPPEVSGGTGGAALYKFSVDRLFTLVDALELRQRLTHQEVFEILGLASQSGITDYRRFLESGQAVLIDDDGWAATPVLKLMAIALRNSDPDDLRKALSSFPSFEMIEAELAKQAVGTPLPPNTFGRAMSTFTALAEITRLGATVFGEGFFVTPTTPSDAEFADIALAAYEKLDEGSGLVETGRWIEELIKAFGVHPEISRLRLQTAAERNLIRRVTEGSTTDTKLDRHAVRVLASKGGHPVVRTEHLYRGDFLIPGKASSSLRIEKLNA